MILTLTKDVARLGKSGDRVRVSDAYARNVLVPQKMAIVGEQTLFRASQPQVTFDHEQIKKQLHEVFLVKRKANEKGGLYEKMSQRDISELVAQRLHCNPQNVMCDQKQPLQSLGDFTVSCHIDSAEFSIHLRIEKE